MKTPMMPALRLRAAAALLAGAALAALANAAVVYEDTFSGAKNSPLAGRAPDTINQPKATYLGSAQIVADGQGRAVTNGVNHAVSLPMPKLKAGDIVTLTVDVRAAGSASGYVGLGFTDKVATLSGFAELMASVRSDGAGRVFLGSPQGKPLYLKPANLAGAKGNATEPARITLALDTGKRRLTVHIGATAVFDDTIDYATPERLTHATFQFAAQNLATTEAPAYVDYFKVEVSPAP